MLDDYADIRERIGEEPLWYDRHGVPRYCEFTPERCSDVYAKEVLLMEVGCQECEQRFAVEFTWDGWHSRPSLSARLAMQTLPHYGDPPRHDFDGNCTAGDTMNVIEPRIVGLWVRDGFDWHETDIDLMVEEAQIAEQIRQGGSDDE